MIHRVLLSLLTAAVLLSAVPWELSAQGSAAPTGAADAPQAQLVDSETPGPTESADPVDCVCLCTSGHSTPAMAQNVITTIDDSHGRWMAALPAAQAGTPNSIFHPPQIS